MAAQSEKFTFAPFFFFYERYFKSSNVGIWVGYIQEVDAFAAHTTLFENSSNMYAH